MDDAYLIQFAVSAVAICVMAAVAAWARVPRPTPPLTETAARAIIEDELPDLALGAVWVDALGETAVARSGDLGVVLFRVGDSYAVREAPWERVKAARARNDRLMLTFGDPAAPAAFFKLSGGVAPFAEAAR